MLNRKGIFFTFISIIIMSVFVIIFTPSSHISLDKNLFSIKARISSLDGFVNDLKHTYFENILRASTQKTILSLIYYMNETDSYIANMDAAYAEVATTGMIAGTPIDIITGKKIMENNTIQNLTERIIISGLDVYNINLTLNFSNFRITQTNPWEIEAYMDAGYTLTSEVASWNESNLTVKAKIPIDGMLDPMFLVETNGLYERRIKRSTLQFDEWNLSHVRDQISNGTYVHWEFSSAPSYLMRFTRTIENSSCCGIHSLIAPGNLTPTLSADQAKSYVDYMFWNNSLLNDCLRIYNISHKPQNLGLWDQFNYFKLDLGHLTKYNITSEYYEQGGC